MAEIIKAIRKEKEIGLAFFIMPLDFLRAIRTELISIVGEDRAAIILFKCGSASGKALVERMNLSSKVEDLHTILSGVWLEIGLGRLRMEKGEGDYTIHIFDSIEAQAVGNIGKNVCNLTRGYLAGTVTALTGKEYDCIELKCRSNNNPHCLYTLTEK
ncbi:MAG: V4R domain-containing protein [Candidatus Thermoplasmatota archaeon]